MVVRPDLLGCGAVVMSGVGWTISTYTCTVRVLPSKSRAVLLPEVRGGVAEVAACGGAREVSTTCIQGVLVQILQDRVPSWIASRSKVALRDAAFRMIKLYSHLSQSPGLFRPSGPIPNVSDFCEYSI